MLERLTLYNFQAHEKLKIIFSPHVTTIVGNSDVGKTTVLRALGWVATNKPNGDQFVRHGTDVARVVLRVDGRTVERKRGKGVNSYAVDGEPLKAFAQDVPEPVARLLNISPANFQGQHDAPFWFSDTAGNVSRALNAVVNLGAIDDALTYLAGRARKAAARKGAAGDRKAAAEETWRSVRGAATTANALEGVEGMAANAQALATRCKTARELVEKGVRHYRERDHAANVAVRATAALAAGERWRAASVRQSWLQAAVDRAQQCAPARTRIPEPEALTNKAAGAQIIGARHRVLGDLIQRAMNFEYDRVGAAGRAAAGQKKFDKLMGERCPLCGKPIKK